MSSDEILDVVNENNEVIGQATRAEVKEKGLMCRVSTVYLEDEQGRILVTQRSLKCSYPLTFYAAAGGHLDAGETYEQGAIREAKEEIGVDIYDLEYIGEFMGTKGKSFNRLFLAKYKGEFKPDANEVERLEWMTLDELDHLMVRFPYLLMPSFMTTFKIYKEYKNAQ